MPDVVDPILLISEYVARVCDVKSHRKFTATFRDLIEAF